MSNWRALSRPLISLIGMVALAEGSPALGDITGQAAAAKVQKAYALSQRAPFWVSATTGEGQTLSADLESAVPPATSGEAYTAMLGVAAARANSEARINNYRIAVDAQAVPCEVGGNYSYTGNPSGSRYDINVIFHDCQHDGGALFTTNGSMILSVNTEGEYRSTLASVRFGDDVNALVTGTLLFSEPVTTGRYERRYTLSGKFLRRHEVGGILVGDYKLDADGGFTGVGQFMDTTGMLVTSTEKTTFDRLGVQGNWTYVPETGAQNKELKIQKGTIADATDFDGVFQSDYRYEFKDFNVSNREGPEGNLLDVDGEGSIVYPPDADSSCVDGYVRVSSPRSLVSDGAGGFRKGRLNVDGNIHVEFDATASFPVVMRIPGGQVFEFFALGELEAMGGCFF